jgi:phosphoglycerate dehydrogenase-like enzyme
MLREVDLLEWLPSCAAAVAGAEPVTERVLKACPSLRVVARTGVGFDSVDRATASALGVAVTVTPGTNHESVAEHTFALLLAVTRRIAENDRIIRAGGWDRTLVRPIRGRTIGLVGLGRIGRAMVPRAKAFGMHVLACDPFLDPEYAEANQIGVRELDELIEQSDILSLHAPATPETYRLLDAGRIARMPRGSIVLNTARGTMIDQEALAEAVRSGHVLGAGLDVLDPEPASPENPLIGLPNVVISPHMGGLDTLAMAAMAESAAQSIIDLHAGRALGPGYWANPEIEEGWKW